GEFHEPRGPGKGADCNRRRCGGWGGGGALASRRLARWRLAAEVPGEMLESGEGCVVGESAVMSRALEGVTLGPRASRPRLMLGILLLASAGETPALPGGSPLRGRER